MTVSKVELLKKLSDNVVEMEEEEVVEACQEYLALGYPAFDGIMEGLVDGMNRASKLFEEEEYFVTDVLLCSDAMYQGLEILRPHLLESEEAERKPIGVIGVVEGDTHDIGKNLVKIMLETAGYEMVDLGRDVPLRSFIETAKETNATFICLSTLMTTTMGGMSDVVKLLQQEGMREQVKVVIGGGPISKKYADTIGADGYAANAVEAVKIVNSLLSIAYSGGENIAVNA